MREIVSRVSYISISSNNYLSSWGQSSSYIGEIVSRVSYILIDICEPMCGIVGAYIAIRGIEAGINTIIETIITGTISSSYWLNPTSISRSL